MIGWAVLSLISCITASFIQHHEDFIEITLIVWLVALFPVAVLCILCFILAAASYILYERKNKLELVINLRNSQSFKNLGFQVGLAENLKWFVVIIDESFKDGKI